MFVSELPELQSIEADHLDAYDGLLPYLLLADLVRWYEDRVRAGDSDLARRFLAIVELLLTTDVEPPVSDQVWNLMAVSFTESMRDGQRTVAESMVWIGPRTRRMLEVVGSVRLRGGRDITPAVFAMAIERSLHPTLAKHGFSVVTSDDHRWCFERGRISVTATYGGYREGLMVEVSDEDNGERPLALGEVLLEAGVPERELWVASMQTSDADVLIRLLDRAAELQGKYGTPFLHGDPDAFARAYAGRADRAREYNRLASVSSFTLAEADDAWHASDYEGVLELLAPIRPHLDATRLRRLDFAERQKGPSTER